MTVVTNPARSNSEEDIETVENSKPADIETVENSKPSDNETVENSKPGDIELSSDGVQPVDSDRLYDDERQSDVVFVAGINGDTWRYPGHRRILAATSPMFAALLSENTEVVVVDYVDRRGFEQLLRYYYCEPTQLNSVGTARCTLDTAYKFLCPALAERCARRLDEMLDAGVALEILRDLRYYCARLPGAASAPTLPALIDDAAARSLAQCSRWCDCLAHNALLVLDNNADEALADERLEELTYEDLSLIVRRPTFRVSNELILIEALSRWATATCKRWKRELTSPNKRAALGELSYCPRYLLLSGEELDRALALELLEPIERALVLARARKLSAPIPVGAEQEGLLRRWARPRPTAPAALPVHLSSRSDPLLEESQPSKLCARRFKRPKQPSFNPDDKNQKDGCCACFCDGFLRAFICLFD